MALVLKPHYPVRGECIHGDLIPCGDGYELKVKGIFKEEIRSPIWLNVKKLEALKAEIQEVIEVIETINQIDSVTVEGGK